MLADLRVVELSSYIAAPAAAGILADWGADVVKVEPRAGDPMRWVRADGPDGCTPVFETNNRGKRSIALDLAEPADRAVLDRLIGRADVFITNMRPGALRRARLDWDTLSAACPSLVYASVSGYGLAGAEADTPAFDNAAFWSRSGMAMLTRPDGSDPFSVRQGTGDHACALSAALGIMAALYRRTQTGKGGLVEASLLRSAVYLLGAELSSQRRMGSVTPTRPRHAPVNPLNNFYRSAEGRWFFFMTRSDRDWHAICALIDRPDLCDDERFTTPAGRMRHSAELTAALDRGFEQRPFAMIAAGLGAADIVWSPLQQPADVLADPQAEAAGCWVEMEDRGGTGFRAPGMPVALHDTPVRQRARMPAVDEHGAEIRAELGLAPPALT